MDHPHFCSIVNAMRSVKKPGVYASGGICSMMFPSLSINSTPGVILDLPLHESQARSIISSATRVSFDEGDQTVTDASNCCVWQLYPTQFSINNVQWSEQLKGLVNRVKDELGCDATARVTCDLNKLLLYEPGGFLKVSNGH